MDNERPYDSKETGDVPPQQLGLFQFRLDEEFLVSHISIESSSALVKELSEEEILERNTKRDEDAARQRQEDEVRRTSISLPATDEMRRDWMRPNRRMSYLYPDVILPSWRRV